MAVWPFPKEVYTAELWHKTASTQQKGKSLAPWHRHHWNYSSVLNRFVCTTCHNVSRFKKRTRCKGAAQGTNMPKHLQGVHASHDMYTTVHEVTGEALWYCNLCGKYTQARLRGLTSQCSGVCKSKTPPWYVADRLRNGCHPISAAFWGRPLRGLHAGFVNDSIDASPSFVTPEPSRAPQVHGAPPMVLGHEAPFVVPPAPSLVEGEDNDWVDDFSCHLMDEDVHDLVDQADFFGLDNLDF